MSFITPSGHLLEGVKSCPVKGMAERNLNTELKTNCEFYYITISTITIEVVRIHGS